MFKAIDSTKSRTRVALFSSFTLLFVFVPVMLAGSSSANANNSVKIAIHALTNTPTVQYIEVKNK